MMNTLNKSCIVNQNKMLSEYTWISSFCFVNIGQIQKFRVSGMMPGSPWFTEGPYWIHDGIYPDCATPGKLTVWILLTYPRGGVDFCLRKSKFSAWSEPVSSHSGQGLHRPLWSCAHNQWERQSVFFPVFSREALCCRSLPIFVEQANCIPKHRHPVYWAQFAIWLTKRGETADFEKAIPEIKYCLSEAQPHWEVK